MSFISAFGQKELVKTIIKMTSAEMMFVETLSLKMLPFDIATVNKEEEVAETLIELGFSYKSSHLSASQKARINRLLVDCVIRGQFTSSLLIAQAGRLRQELFS